MEENFIDFIDVILPFDDEVLYDDIKFPARREGIARLCKEVFGLVKVKLKSNGKRKDGRFLGCIALPRSYFGEMAAVMFAFLYTSVSVMPLSSIRRRSASLNGSSR